MKLILVDWIDSHSGNDWQSLDQLKDASKPLYCRSVGWLVSDRKKCKVIVPHIAGERNQAVILQGCGDMAIPTQAIRRITTLREE